MEHLASQVFDNFTDHGILAGSLKTGLAFLLAYPFVTCLLWSCSGLYYLFCHDKAKRADRGQATTPDYTVLIPFHAEPEAALNTMRSLAGVTPQPTQIVIIDDGSPVAIPAALPLPENVRIVRLDRNQGKAGALQSVLGQIDTEIIVCLDADTQSESPDWAPMLAAFNDPALAAVTGKIRPAHCGNLVEWFQALDYLTVIAVIKAAESAWGGLLTVSGAFTAYRTSALRSIGGWSSKSATEDIDASWRLQAKGWRLSFEKDWVARVEMAPNLRALWRQRRRWSAGLGRAIRDHGAVSMLHGARHLPIMVITLASALWITAILTLAPVNLLNWTTATPTVPAATPFSFHYVILTGIVAFYAQLVTAVAVDGRRLRQHWRSILIAPFYPVYFWCLLVTSFLIGFPTGFLRRDKGAWKRTLRRNELSSVK